MTLLLGPPASGKSTLLLALAGKLDSSLKVSTLDKRVTYICYALVTYINPERIMISFIVVNSSSELNSVPEEYCIIESNIFSSIFSSEFSIDRIFVSSNQQNMISEIVYPKSQKKRKKSLSKMLLLSCSMAVVAWTNYKLIFVYRKVVISRTMAINLMNFTFKGLLHT